MKPGRRMRFMVDDNNPNRDTIQGAGWSVRTATPARGIGRQCGRRIRGTIDRRLTRQRVDEIFNVAYGARTVISLYP